MEPGSRRPRQCGLRTRDRYHRRNGRVAANHRSGFAATASISRSRSRSSPSACLNAPGGRSNGVRGALNPCRRDSLAFVFALPIRIISSRSLAPEEWLLIEWPKGQDEPTKYWLSTLPANIILPRLVDIAKLRWRIERDYEELKQEVGLGHFEGRSWRGFHHHGTLCIAAYGFLVSERETIPPCGPRPARLFEELAVHPGYRPRGAADKARASHTKLDRHHAATPHRCACTTPLTLPVLQPPVRTDEAFSLVTQ